MYVTENPQYIEMDGEKVLDGYHTAFCKVSREGHIVDLVRFTQEPGGSMVRAFSSAVRYGDGTAQVRQLSSYPHVLYEDGSDVEERWRGIVLPKAEELEALGLVNLRQGPNCRTMIEQIVRALGHEWKPVPGVSVVRGLGYEI